MSFFIRKRSAPFKASKNKLQQPSATDPVKQKKKKKLLLLNEDIPSDEDDDILSGEEKSKREYSSEEETETVQEKRLRLAKQYLAQLEEEESRRKEDEEVDRDAISHRLKQDVLEHTGVLQKDTAQYYLPVAEEDIHVKRGHQLSITCLVITPDDRYIFSGSKDCTIIKWDIQTGRKVRVIPRGKKSTEHTAAGHLSHVMCLALSTDGKFLASGDNNRFIYIWDPATCQHLHTFKGHRGVVSGVTFRKGTHQLFSASHDRTVKIWNVDEMVYVETLFGHQDSITAIDSLTRERAVTSGGRDGTLRIWKVVEESQLVFHGHRGSIDCVALINEGHFISGADDNSIALWSVSKKKPLVTVYNAHSGPHCVTSENWISAVASLQNTDLVASAGSRDGCIRLWRCGPGFCSLILLFTIPVTGFVNSLKFSSSGNFMVAGIGQEHRLGRWWRLKEAKNSICIINLQQTQNKNENVMTKTLHGINM